MLKPNLPITVAAWFVMAMFLYAESPEAGPQTPEIELSELPVRTEEELRKLLMAPVRPDFQNVPLRDVLQSIGKSTGVEIYLDKQSLAADGIKADDAVSLKAEPMPAAHVLERILPDHVTWFLDEGFVHVTTAIHHEELFITRVYDVADLLAYGQKHLPIEVCENETASLLVPVQFGEAHACPHCQRNDPTTAWLRDAIGDFVDGIWWNMETTGGDVTFVNQALVVRNTRRVHAHVEAFLQTLRDLTQAKISPQSREIRPWFYASQQDEAIRKALTQNVNVRYRNVPLNKLLAELADKFSLSVKINQAELNEEGVSQEEPITGDFNNLPFETVLRLILDPLGLIALIENGQLLITTRHTYDYRFYTAVYDIRDLHQEGYRDCWLSQALQMSGSANWKQLDVTGGSLREPLNGLLLVRNTEQGHRDVFRMLSELRKQMAERHSQGVKIKSPQPKRLVVKVYSTQFRGEPEKLEQALYTMVRPKSWAKRGGRGEIQPLQDRLIIKQSINVHREIQDFLNRLDEGADEVF
jgi:hypothetical protein